MINELEIILGPGTLESIKGMGNSQVYKWNTYNQNYFIKKYPDDKWPRREVETKYISYLESKSFSSHAKLIETIPHLNINIFEFIHCKKLNKIDSNCYQFYENFLNSIKLININSSLNLAKESVLNSNDIINHIDLRIMKLKSLENTKLNQYLSLKIVPEYFRIKSNLINEIDYCDYLIASPSDFGLHNTIIDDENNIRIIDFEYSGKDSMYKLLADLYWHPSCGFDSSQIKRLYATYYKLGIDRSKLFNLIKLIGIKWCLLLLNEFDYTVFIKRLSAFQSKIDWEEIKVEKLNKSENYLNKIKNLSIYNEI